MDGHIIFKSILNVPNLLSPDIFTVGAFSVIDPVSKKSISFDFEDYYANVENDSNNNELFLHVDLEEFDLDFLSDNTDNLCKPYVSQERMDELLMAYDTGRLDEILTHGELEEIFYECYGLYGEKMHIPLKLVSFEIGNYEFSKEAINKYNKKMLAEEYDNVLQELNTDFENYKIELEEEV